MLLFDAKGHAFPTVVDMFGSVGGLVEYRSALLASRGVCSLALAYFGMKGLPASYLNLNLEIF